MKQSQKEGLRFIETFEVSGGEVRLGFGEVAISQKFTIMLG